MLCNVIDSTPVVTAISTSRDFEKANCRDCSCFISGLEFDWCLFIDSIESSYKCCAYTCINYALQDCWRIRVSTSYCRKQWWFNSWARVVHLRKNCLFRVWRRAKISWCCCPHLQIFYISYKVNRTNVTRRDARTICRHVRRRKVPVSSSFQRGPSAISKPFLKFNSSSLSPTSANYRKC